VKSDIGGSNDMIVQTYFSTKVPVESSCHAYCISILGDEITGLASRMDGIISI